jgi:hypothetical protein
MELRLTWPAGQKNIAQRFIAGRVEVQIESLRDGRASEIPSSPFSAVPPGLFSLERIPAINRWAIVERPIRDCGIQIFRRSHLPPMSQPGIIEKPETARYPASTSKSVPTECQKENAHLL